MNVKCNVRVAQSVEHWVQKLWDKMDTLKAHLDALDTCCRHLRSTEYEILHIDFLAHSSPIAMTYHCALVRGGLPVAWGWTCDHSVPCASVNYTPRRLCVLLCFQSICASKAREWRVSRNCESFTCRRHLFCLNNICPFYELSSSDALLLSGSAGRCLFSLRCGLARASVWVSWRRSKLVAAFPDVNPGDGIQKPQLRDAFY